MIGFLLRTTNAPEPSSVERYLDQLARSLWFLPWRKGRLLREARDHLYEAVDSGLARGLPRRVAEDAAVARFGRIDDLVSREAGALLWLLLTPPRRVGWAGQRDAVTTEEDSTKRIAFSTNLEAFLFFHSHHSQSAGAEWQLCQALDALTPLQRMYMLQGLLRPQEVLVAGYTAPGGRCCPLMAAVWQATGHEATDWRAVVDGIAALRLTGNANQFYKAFDDWAWSGDFAKRDHDGAIVLTADGRSRLIALLQNRQRTQTQR